MTKLTRRFASQRQPQLILASLSDLTWWKGRGQEKYQSWKTTKKNKRKNKNRSEFKEREQGHYFAINSRITSHCHSWY